MIETANGIEKIATNFVFMGPGVVSNSEMAIEALGVKIGNKNEILVNSRLQTSVPNVYAIGNLIALRWRCSMPARAESMQRAT